MVAPSIAWLASQLIKYILRVVRNRSLQNYSLFYQSGGMPSAHAAVVVAMLTVVALTDGLGSGLFTVAFILAAVVIYDSLHVRRAVGEQGLALRQLQKKMGLDTPFYRADGHILPQAIAGVLLGAIIGVAVYLLL